MWGIFLNRGFHMWLRTPGDVSTATFRKSASRFRGSGVQETQRNFVIKTWVSYPVYLIICMQIFQNLTSKNMVGPTHFGKGRVYLLSNTDRVVSLISHQMHLRQSQEGRLAAQLVLGPWSGAESAAAALCSFLKPSLALPLLKCSLLNKIKPK